MSNNIKSMREATTSMCGMNEVKLVFRPWRTQDLIEDLQMLIDEEPDGWMNERRTILLTAQAYLKEYFGKGERIQELMQADNDKRVVVLPCRIDDSVYVVVGEKEPRKSVQYRVEELQIDHFTIGRGMFPMITGCSSENVWQELIDGRRVGDEYWLSRKEAEYALELIKPH